MSGPAGAWALIVLLGSASMGGGALLALLARRIHPALSLKRLWLFYTGLLGFAGAIIVAVVWR